MSVTPGRTLGVSTTSDEIDTLLHTGSNAGFFGTAPTTQPAVTQEATTKTTTQLRAELTALQDALATLGIISVS
jgi:hypothetical protein